MRTPLYDVHGVLGAKMVEFSGWQVPLHYGSAIAEHQQVRQDCGVFDVSHMGEIIVSGEDALPFLQYVTCNDVARLAGGQGQYTVFLNKQGGCIDDLLLYRLSAHTFLLCVNAANTDKCYTHLQTKRGKWRRFALTNSTNAFCQFALQGRNSDACLHAVLQKHKVELRALEYFEIVSLKLAGKNVYLARSGYTGERGYELYLPPVIAPQVWKEMLAAGAKPIGFAARDTLRLESCFLLHGNDIDANVTPLEAGIGWTVKFNKGTDFIGKSALQEAKSKGLQKKLVAFKMLARGYPRTGMSVTNAENAEIGKVTSGSIFPTVGGFGGLAMLTQSSLDVGARIFIANRDKSQAAEIVSRPFYKHVYKE